jgi:hypothetical protein
VKPRGLAGGHEIPDLDLFVVPCGSEDQIISAQTPFSALVRYAAAITNSFSARLAAVRCQTL